jgi:hypothetical protein
MDLWNADFYDPYDLLRQIITDHHNHKNLRSNIKNYNRFP